MAVYEWIVILLMINSCKYSELYPATEIAEIVYGMQSEKEIKHFTGAVLSDLVPGDRLQ